MCVKQNTYTNKKKKYISRLAKYIEAKSMAISHVQPLLLFVSLFFLPAALGTAIEFSNCHRPLFTGVVNITKVEIIPYPIKYNDNPIFKITGVTCMYYVIIYSLFCWFSITDVSSSPNFKNTFLDKYLWCEHDRL